MTMQLSERDQLIKMQQQLQDHESRQLSDMDELKRGIGRIEAKMDFMSENKAGKGDVEDLTTDLRQVQQNQWGLVVAIIAALITAIGSLIRTGILK